MTAVELATCGAVVIGRNEGKRLERCLLSITGKVKHVVYVDSGSTDNSLAIALERGAEVVELDMSIPFSAARARNAGFERLRALQNDVTYVQFVDGDCELIDGWLATAISFLDQHGDVAVVSGRLKERFPERSVYNLLCDLEWDTPIGEVKACGGIALMRVCAFQAQGGFRQMIAGEEPELCVRLRQADWKIWRIDAEMGWHDADMTRFSQWWKRSVRGGYAFAEGASLHGAPPERHWVIESRRALTWGVGVPVVILFVAVLISPKLLLLLVVYPLQVLRIALRSVGPASVRWIHALFLVMSKFPEAWGCLKFYWRSRIADPSSQHLIEYK